MKKIYSRFRLPILVIFLALISHISFAQCINQGTIAEPGCGSSNTTNNVGGKQSWSLNSTIGGDYTVTLSSGSNSGCGTYTASPSSFTASGSSTNVDILAGGSCCWAAGGTSAVLTYTRVGYTNTTTSTNICAGATRALTVSPTPFSPGTWSVINGTGTGTVTGTTFTAVSAGTVTLRFSKGGCNSDVGITILAAPTTAVITGGNQSVCGLTVANLNGNTPSAGTGTWSQLTGPGTTTFGAINSGSSNATVTAYGTYTYQWSISNGTCGPSTATVNVTYSQAPSTASVGGTQNICAALTSAALGSTAPAVGTGTWTQFSGPGVSSFSAPNSVSSTATAPVYGTYVYRWTVANGACPSNFADVTVNYYATPTPATAGGTQDICGSLSSGSLGGNSPLIGTGVWTQTSGPGTTTFSSSASSPNATATATVPGTYVYTWTISNGTCPSSSANVTVNFYATPSLATIATSPLSACGTLTSPALGGNTPAVGTGTWTQLSGPGTSTFSNVNSGSSTATATVLGSYVYTWTISNGTCPSNTANVTVNYLNNPTAATVGPDQDTCTAVLISAPLGGNTPVIGTGTWTQTSGPGVTFFSSVNGGNSTASVSVQGTYVFTWTIANGGCTSSASITVNYYSTPPVATAGSTQNFCGSLTSGPLGGNPAAPGTGVWTQISGPGTTVFSNPNQGNATATASIPGSYVYEWTISNGTCPTTSADITVNFLATPTGGSIPNASYCSANGSGTVSVVGVSNATQYTWALPAGLSGSSTSSSITVGGTIGGTYTVTVTPLNVAFGVTCTGSPITGTVTILSQPVIDSIHAGSVRCFGGTDTLTVYGRTNNGSLFYSIDAGTTYANTTGLFPGLSAGSYTVIVRDDSLCATPYPVNPVVITTAPDIFLSIASFSNVLCNGDSSGYVNVSASGGTGAITYLWSNGATAQNISHLAAGTFTVTATDGNGCTKIISQVITEPVALTDSISSTNVSCFGANDGTATFYVSGGSPPYTYLWSNGGDSSTIVNLAGANYSVTATDNNGCIAVASVNIVNPLPVALTLSVANVSCFGAGNGQVTANVTGGSGSYTYTWSPNVSTGSTATTVGPGTYVVTVTDANGCTDIDSAVVTQPLTGLAVSSIVTPVRCTGDSNGSIQLLPSGGVGGYTYLWSSGQQLQIISGLPAGNYSATVTDGNGCQAVIFDTLVDPTPIVSGVAGTSATCAGAGGGSADLTVSGGVAPYTYLWSTLETTEDISNLNGGLYRVIITDANGCQHSDSVIITQPQPLSVSFAVANVGCNGASTGAITATVSGGTGAYGYAWTPNVSTGPTVTSAGPGTYVLTITDGNGCTLVDSAVITQPAAALAITATVTDITCTGASNGSITTQVSGGSGSYTYAWTGTLATTPSISGLSAGSYTVTVTDANGCTAAAGGVITNPTPIASTTVGTDVTCAGRADGTATVTAVSGGTAPYTYLWMGFQTTASASGFSGGTIRVIITDANGCDHHDSVIISEPQPLVITLATTNINCAGGNGSVTANVTGGTGAYTYAWTPAVSTGSTVSPATAGVYTVTVTDANSCAATATTTVTQPQALNVSIASTNVLCFGDSTGTINLSVSGGSGTYTYTWSPNVSTGPSVTNAAPGTYAFTVTDGNGCTLQNNVVVSQPASPIIVTTVVHNITCNGLADGSILVVASGGTGNYTYNWSTGDSVQYVTNLGSNLIIASTLYIVTVTDANGCQAIRTDTLRNPPPIISSIAATNVTCAGANDGSAILTVSGGRPGYTYLWSNFATTKDLNNVAGGTYSVLITDTSGCRHIDTITIQQPLPLTVTLSTINVSCFGAANGSVTATVTGGTGTYAYAWTGSASTGPTVSGAGPGTYTVTVTDGNSCTQTATATITQPASAVNLTLAVTAITCAGANDGSISTQVSGGSGSYTYAWTGSPALSPSISSLGAGVYSVTVTDAGGCTATASTTLTNPAAITSTTTGTNVTCAGAADGTAAVTVSGGTAPYTYLWNSFANTASVSGLSGGVARVIITDAHGCTHRDSIIITEPQPLTATISSTNVGCTGTNGTITVSVSGGTGAYTYTWSPNVSSGPNVSAGAGVYHVTVTDANGCRLVDSAVISQPASTLAVTATVVDMTCHNANNGAISTNVSGGSGSYTYAWTGTPAPVFTPSISGLSAGTYTVTVTDAGGCTASASGTITNPADITSSVTGTNVTCAGDNNGSAQLTVNGGQLPYTFLWSNFGGTQSLDSLTGGLYRVIITDAHGCVHRDSIFITEPLPVTAPLSVTQITCNNLNDGAITAAGAGGTGTLSYQWSAPGSQTTATISALSAGTYSVTVRDINGCSVSSSATIINPSPLSAASVVINPRCNASNNGTVTLVVNGGTPAYSYSWTGGLTGQSSIGVAPGTYYVTVTDSHGCTATDSAKVIAPAPIFVSGIITNVSCNGSRDGSAIVTVYGGALPYSYQWHYDSLNGALGPITKDFIQVSGGDYYLVITDANGCDASYHAVIKEADSLRLTLSKTNVTCFGANDGTLLASATGGTTPYHYLWNNFVTDSSQSGVASGNYGVVVTDSNGCQQTRTINLNQPQPIIVSLVATDPACNGASTGTIAANVSGGTSTGTYNYTWSSTPAQSTSTATGLPAGTYYVTVTDANACARVDSATLTAPQALVVNTAISNPTCADGNNGFVSLDVRQGTAPYTYTWNTNPAQTGNVASGLTAGTYIANITDAGGCTLINTAVVAAPPAIVISLGTVGNSTCVSSADGYAVVNATGGLAQYTYQVGALAQDSSTFANLAPGAYTVSVRDANGCSAVTSWTIGTVSNFTVDLAVDHEVILTGETIQLTATPTSDTAVLSYSWGQFDSLDFSGCGNAANCPTPTAMPNGSHTYTVEATNARGCTARDTVHVTVSNQPSAFMPTAFTPNGDGINDHFEFDILGAKVIDVQIWNRWGEKIFADPAQPNGITGTNGWDGSFRGKIAEFDTYTYQLTITYNNGQQKTMAGTITLMR